MTEWNTNMGEARGTVLISWDDGTVDACLFNSISVGLKGASPIAWMPLPEPYQEPCPKQWKASELYHANKTDDLSNIIRTVERRTLEIVKWHLKNFGVEGLLAYCDGKGPKND